MTEITVRPATVERVEDALVVLETGGGGACVCQYWRLTSSEYSKTGVDRRRTLLRQQAAAEPPPGMIGYVDDVPAGWCGFGIRGDLGRLVRSRTIPVVDDLPCWAIVCFTVRVGYRRLGLARALLDGVIDYARAHAAPALEAYAVDPAGKRIHGTAAYVGTTSMFEAAGFRRVLETDARSARLPRWLMRLDLAT
jgi:GNAT superfamily N-acetyltransferase